MTNHVKVNEAADAAGNVDPSDPTKADQAPQEQGLDHHEGGNALEQAQDGQDTEAEGENGSEAEGAGDGQFQSGDMNSYSNAGGDYNQMQMMMAMQNGMPQNFNGFPMMGKLRLRCKMFGR